MRLGIGVVAWFLGCESPAEEAGAVASSVAAPPAGALRVSAAASTATSRSVETWRDDVFGFRLPLPMGQFEASVAFDNPASEGFVIKRRVVFRSRTLAEIVVDVWDCPAGMDLFTWIDRNRDFVLYSDAVWQGVRFVGVRKHTAIVATTRGGQAPDKDLVIFQAGNLVYRVMYVDTDNGASRESFLAALAGFEE